MRVTKQEQLQNSDDGGVVRTTLWVCLRFLLGMEDGKDSWIIHAHVGAVINRNEVVNGSRASSTCRCS